LPRGDSPMRRRDRDPDWPGLFALFEDENDCQRASNALSRQDGTTKPRNKAY